MELTSGTTPIVEQESPYGGGVANLFRGLGHIAVGYRPQVFAYPVDLNIEILLAFEEPEELFVNLRSRLLDLCLGRRIFCRTTDRVSRPIATFLYYPLDTIGLRAAAIVREIKRVSLLRGLDDCSPKNDGLIMDFNDGGVIYILYAPQTCTA